MDFHTNSKLKLAYRCRILNHVQYDKVTGAVDLAGKVRTVDQLKGGGGNLQWRPGKHVPSPRVIGKINKILF